MTPMVRPPPPASHGLSMAAVGTDFAAFFGSYFSGRAEISDSSQTGCGIYEAVLLQWIRQAQILATHIGKLAGARTSVHMLTTCLNPQVGTVLSRPGGAPVTIHPGHNLELRRIVGQLEAHQKKPCCGEWGSSKFLTLLKWQIVGYTAAELIVFLDLDVELLPFHLSRPRSKTLASAADWHALLVCASKRNESMFSWSDHASPVNAGLMIVKPSTTLYRTGLEVLKSAVFNQTHGWELVGRPSVAVPPTDDAWRVQPGALRMFDRDNWVFVHAGLDQGFFFHMYRVRNHMGADLRLSCGAAVGKGVTKLHHYAAGSKPERTITCLPCPDRDHATFSGDSGMQRPTYQLNTIFVSIEKVARHKAVEIVVSMSWARRTMDDLNEVLRKIRANLNVSALSTVKTGADAAGYRVILSAISRLGAALHCTNSALTFWHASGASAERHYKRVSQHFLRRHHNMQALPTDKRQPLPPVRADVYIRGLLPSSQMAGPVLPLDETAEARSLPGYMLSAREFIYNYRAFQDGGREGWREWWKTHGYKKSPGVDTSGPEWPHPLAAELGLADGTRPAVRGRGSSGKGVGGRRGRLSRGKRHGHGRGRPTH